MIAKPCKTFGCEEYVYPPKAYCGTCAQERKRKQTLNSYYRRQGGRHPIAWKTMTVVHDPSPWPLEPGLVLNRHETALMIQYGSMTPGMVLADPQGNEYVYEDELCQSN